MPSSFMNERACISHLSLPGLYINFQYEQIENENIIRNRHIDTHTHLNIRTKTTNDVLVSSDKYLIRSCYNVVAGNGLRKGK